MTTDGRRTVTYCLVPRHLAPKLHEALWQHFREEASVDVVVERRHSERRTPSERRTEADPRGAAEAAVEGNSGSGSERRRIRNAGGRRVGERRAVLAPSDPPFPLPRKARPHASELVWVERVEPSAEQLEDLDTARIVTRFQGGDREAFGLLYMRYFDRVYSYLRMVFREDMHEAEDLTQQVFTQVLAALPRYERRRQPFRGWLFVIVRNEAITHLNRRSRSEVVDPAEIGRRRDVPTPVEDGLAALDWISDSELLMFVERLPLAQRQVLVLRYMLDLTSSQVAEILGRSPADVRGMEHRARRFLASRLAAVGRAPQTRRGRLQALPRRRSLPPSLRQRRFALVP